MGRVLNDKIWAKEVDSSDGDLTYHMFNLESAIAHLKVRNPSGILAVET